MAEVAAAAHAGGPSAVGLRLEADGCLPDGTSLADAVVRRDIPILLAVVLTLSVIVVVCNLLVDLAYSIIDPRVRLS